MKRKAKPQPTAPAQFHRDDRVRFVGTKRKGTVVTQYKTTVRVTWDDGDFTIADARQLQPIT